MVDVQGYLRRLRLDDPGPPSVDGLRRLHRAQVERVAYENLDIHLGRVLSIEPVASFARVVAGRGGDCLHRNRAVRAPPAPAGHAGPRPPRGGTGPAPPRTGGGHRG